METKHLGFFYGLHEDKVVVFQKELDGETRSIAVCGVPFVTAMMEVIGIIASAVPKGELEEAISEWLAAWQKMLPPINEAMELKRGGVSFEVIRGRMLEAYPDVWVDNAKGANEKGADVT